MIAKQSMAKFKNYRCKKCLLLLTSFPKDAMRKQKNWQNQPRGWYNGHKDVVKKLSHKKPLAVLIVNLAEPLQVVRRCSSTSVVCAEIFARKKARKNPAFLLYREVEKLLVASRSTPYFEKWLVERSKPNLAKCRCC